MVCSCRVVQPRNASTEVQRVYAVISSGNWWASSERRLLRYVHWQAFHGSALCVKFGGAFELAVRHRLGFVCLRI